MWLEVEIMKEGTDANKVIKKFTATFAGGPPFNSGYFITFMERQGIKVMKSPPITRVAMDKRSGW